MKSVIETIIIRRIRAYRSYHLSIIFVEFVEMAGVEDGTARLGRYAWCIIVCSYHRMVSRIKFEDYYVADGCVDATGYILMRITPRSHLDSMSCGSFGRLGRCIICLCCRCLC